MIEAWTDGACKQNGSGGWAWVARFSSGKEVEDAGHEQEATNQRMELMAPIMLLETLRFPHMVTIHSDSKYVVEGIKSWFAGWLKNGWVNSSGKPVANQDLWVRLDKAIKRHMGVEFVHKRGHVKATDSDYDPAIDKMNARADKLAVAASRAEQAAA